MKDLLTTYLYGLYAVRGGQLAPADAMAHVLDLMAAARKSKAAIENLFGQEDHTEGSTAGNEGEQHA